MGELKGEMRKLIGELRQMGDGYLGASSRDSKWDHKSSFQHGVGQGLLYAAGRLEERLGQLGRAEAMAEDMLRFSREEASDETYK